jgi:hypothetical protein
VVLSGCRLGPKGRLNVIKRVCELVQIDKNVFKQVCMKFFDGGVREHSRNAATTSKMASAQEVCGPLQASSRPPHSVLFGAWILLRSACNPMLGRVQECLFPVLLRLQTLVSGRLLRTTSSRRKAFDWIKKLKTFKPIKYLLASDRDDCEV